MIVRSFTLKSGGERGDEEVGGKDVLVAGITMTQAVKPCNKSRPGLGERRAPRMLFTVHRRRSNRCRALWVANKEESGQGRNWVGFCCYVYDREDSRKRRGGKRGLLNVSR